MTLYEHVQGYQVFANQGQRMDLNVIKQVEDSHGKTVFKQEPDGTAVLTPASRPT